MANPGERYRKLPGHRRGIVRSSSLWIAGDHLLSVNSYRVREEYKRFHLRDVQAIVIARTPRFHISTRSLLIGIIWLWIFTAARVTLPAAFTTTMWLIAAALVCAWLYISLALSCRCRLLTAVSRDDLPSLYRTWTARRFLARVEPRIAEVQGRLEGNWMEAIDTRTVGPASAASSVPAGGAGRFRRRTLASILFVGSLFLVSAALLLTLHSPAILITWFTGLLLLIQVAAVIGVFVEHYRGRLRPGMHRLAIAAIVKLGISYYAGVLIMSMLAQKNPSLDRSTMIMLPAYVVLREIVAGVDFVLGLIGAALLLGRE